MVQSRRRWQPYPRSFGGLLTGPSPVDRSRTGSKHHLLVDATGIPLAVALTGGNRNDVTQLLALLDDLHARPVAGKRGRPRQKPDLVLADRGYDHDKYRRLLWARGIKPATSSSASSWCGSSTA
jgi:transposase